MGDFNAEKNAGSYTSLLTACGLSHVESEHRIDHVAVKNCTALTSIADFNAYTGYASDHKPLICDIKIS